MSTGLILAGLGLAAAGFTGRYLLRHSRVITQTLSKNVEAISGGAFSKYYHGGFETKMSRVEASRILGVTPSSNPIKVKEAHKRIMLLNHPDRGGSPYLAAKINEAKDLFDSRKE
uniref:DnaJ homolog subfamily C member 21 n=1 Tax=Plectus sambesii TaxID=2011161 RepID=A0A914W2Z0_9BILA